MPILRLLSRAAAVCLLGGSAVAQLCNAGDTLLKNDIHPAVPSGATTVAIVPGLCDNEAAMAVFTVQGRVTVRKVSIMFGQAQGTNGVVAAVDVEIYDGATVNAQGRWTLGPLVYRLSNGGSNLQISTHALNEHTLTTPVTITSGKLVVGWRMLLNTAVGSCAFGYTSNFCTDFGPACTPGRNVLDALGHGPIDPATYMGFGLPLCPIYFRGDWMIRACVTPDVSVNWTGNATPGGAVALTLLAPSRPNDYYVTMLSMGTSPGTATPWGQLPLNNDFMLQCSLDPGCAPQIIINWAGRLNGNGQAFPVILIPPYPFLINSGFTFYAGFLASASPTWIPFSAVSAPSLPIVIN